MKIRQFDFNLAAALYSSNGVIDEIDHGLFNLLTVKIHLGDRQITFNFSLELYVFMAFFVKGDGFFNNWR